MSQHDIRGLLSTMVALAIGIHEQRCTHHHSWRLQVFTPLQVGVAASANRAGHDALRRISRIQGRATDVVTTPAGDRLIVHFFTQIFEMIPEIAQFQMENSPEAITIRYVAGPGFKPAILHRVRTQVVDKLPIPAAGNVRAGNREPTGTLEQAALRGFQRAVLSRHRAV